MTHIMPRETQLKIVEEIISRMRAERHTDTVVALKTIAGELRAKLGIPRSNALGQIERAMEKLQASKTSLGYDKRRMVEVASVIVSKWPTVRLALEQFGEESAE